MPRPVCVVPEVGRLRLYVPLVAFVMLSALLWRGLSQDPNYMPAALEGRPLPPFELPTLDGRLVTQADFSGSVALINVWATWCPSCHAEHAYLNELARSGVVIYGIDYKDDDAAARRWLQEKGDPYRLMIMDRSGRLGLDLGVTGAPETYVIDAQGIVRLRHQGPVDRRVWKDKLQPLMARLQAESRS